MNTFICCYHIAWIFSQSLYSLLHIASLVRASIVIPVIHLYFSFGFLFLDIEIAALYMQTSISLDIKRVEFIVYLGFGLSFTIFFPYFLHLYPSSNISCSDLVLNAIFILPPLDAVFFTKSLRHQENKNNL
ncbi:hypothetical protein DsansV1_C42g0239171 [Dioscorea sansibarensis]